MKKLVLSMIFLLAATSAFAATNLTMDLATANEQGLTVYGAATDATAATAAMIGKTSTGVGVGLLTGTGGYAVTTQHKNGTKAFGSSYDSTAVFTTKDDVTKGTPYLDEPTKSDSSDFTDANGWKPM